MTAIKRVISYMAHTVIKVFRLRMPWEDRVPAVREDGRKMALRAEVIRRKADRARAEARLKEAMAEGFDRGDMPEAAKDARTQARLRRQEAQLLDSLFIDDASEVFGGTNFDEYEGA